jgi:hypothetical protein
MSGQTVITLPKDHLPVNRQEAIHAREGLPLARSTICSWRAGHGSARRRGAYGDPGRPSWGPALRPSRGGDDRVPPALVVGALDLARRGAYLALRRSFAEDGPRRLWILIHFATAVLRGQDPADIW